MAAVCDICAKGPGFGHNVPWSKKKTKRRASLEPEHSAGSRCRRRNPHQAQCVHLMPQVRQGFSLTFGISDY